MNETTQKDNKHLAHLANPLAIDARIGFTNARQLSLFLLLVSQTNPFNEEEDMTGIISLKSIAEITRKENAKRSGSMNKEVLSFVKNMMESNFVEFQTEIKWKGQKLPKFISIFSILEPIEAPEGNTMYSYKFSEEMRPHLKGFVSDFVSMPIPKGIRSGHTMRFLIMAKAHHDRVRFKKKQSTLKIEVEKLKTILGLKNQYPVFTRFKDRVILQIVEGVNGTNLLKINNWKGIKTGRKITHLEFTLENGELYNLGKRLDFIPSKKDIEALTYSQLKAYEMLKEKGCREGIVYKQIIQKMPSTEYLGWEDVFIRKAWERFEKVTKHKKTDHKAGAFINWWTAGEFKDRLFSELMEEVQAEKKKKSVTELYNRDLAKGIPNGIFLERLNE